ncbi:hypothetical protein [Chitinophaga pinensis]|uniref:hypothetical protein n=1 Tax=Chitinophaga pinensis TaxID=79329 RepID=UPI0021BDE906|nr:hypothetical protein [Chitinophaga pinensis]
MYWCDFNTSQQSFRVYTENESLFLRLFTPAWKTDQWHNYEPLFPAGDISFMQGISSIVPKPSEMKQLVRWDSKHIL